MCTLCAAQTYSPATGSPNASTCDPCPGALPKHVATTTRTLPLTDCRQKHHRACLISLCSLRLAGGAWEGRCAGLTSGVLGPANTSAPRGSDDYTSCTCNAGYSGADGGPCPACVPGKYKPEQGPQDCASCERGTYSNRTAQTNVSTCADCWANTFQNQLGAGHPDDCAACPANTFSARRSTSIADCTCNVGYSGTWPHPLSTSVTVAQMCSFPTVRAKRCCRVTSH